MSNSNTSYLVYGVRLGGRRKWRINELQAEEPSYPWCTLDLEASIIYHDLAEEFAAQIEKELRRQEDSGLESSALRVLRIFEGGASNVDQLVLGVIKACAEGIMSFDPAELALIPTAAWADEINAALRALGMTIQEKYSAPSWLMIPNWD